MKTLFKKSVEADRPASVTGGSVHARDRVLEVACEMFAEAGFHGTHLREICRRAGTNVAGVCYHFQSKEGLYEAVIMEAGRRLIDNDGGLGASLQLPPAQRLLVIVESLMQRLSAERAWIAKLLVRELVDPACGAHIRAAPGLERDFVLLQAVMRDLLRTNANTEAVRLHALSLICECVFYCLAEDNLHHPLTELGVLSPNRTLLARFLTLRSLGALERERTQSEATVA